MAVWQSCYLCNKVIRALVAPQQAGIDACLPPNASQTSHLSCHTSTYYKHEKHRHSTLVLDSSVIFLPEKANFELLSSFRHLYFVYIADLELGMFRS